MRLSSLAIAIFTLLSTPAYPDGGRPSVVLFVMLDDADYYDFGFNSPDALTPNIDSIAREGLTLSQYYTASSLCTPSRASVLTGDNPQHYGISRIWADVPSASQSLLHWGNRGIPAYEDTLSGYMKDIGYNTLHVGKWHLGISEDRFLPDAKGFDAFRIVRAAPHSGDIPVLTESGPIVAHNVPWRAGYETDEIIKFIENSDGRPVFVNWWPLEPHWPVYEPPNFANWQCCWFNTFSNRGKALSMMYRWDQEFGRLLDYLRGAGLYDESLIIVTSDNGGLNTVRTDQGVLRGSKNTVYEAGIRVPFAARWPKVIEPGSESDQLMTSMDVFPTLMAALSGPKPETDGEDLSALFRGKIASRTEVPYWQMRVVPERRYDKEILGDQFAIRIGCFKMLHASGGTGNSYQLFDVCRDPGETHNLADERPKQFEALKMELLARRMESSLYRDFGTVSGAISAETDDRLNIQHDDLTISATVEPGYGPGEHIVYQRGRGVRVSLRGPSIVGEVTGVSDATDAPTIKTVRVEAELPADGKSHEIQFVIRGYLRGEDTIALFVDGEERDKLWGEIRSREPGESVFAVLPEDAPSQVGDNGLILSDYRIFLTAIYPDQMVGGDT